MKKLSYLLLVFIFCITSCSEENETIAPQQPERLSFSNSKITTTGTTRTSAARVVARDNIRGEVIVSSPSITEDERLIYEIIGWGAIDRLYPTPQVFDILYSSVYVYDLTSPGQQILIGSSTTDINVDDFGEDLILANCQEDRQCGFRFELNFGSLASLSGSAYKIVTTIYTFGVSEPLVIDEQFLDV